MNKNISSLVVPSMLGPKVIYTRPLLWEVLEEVSYITDRIVIWSSIKKSIIELMAGFLFMGLRPLFEILGQDGCTKIETSPRKFLTGFNSSQEIFLKVLVVRLFSNPCGSAAFSPENTLLIDDSLEKCIYNENGNATFLKNWTRINNHDNFLIESLMRGSAIYTYIVCLGTYENK